jgi:hypothetical protein
MVRNANPKNLGPLKTHLDRKQELQNDECTILSLRENSLTNQSVDIGSLVITVRNTNRNTNLGHVKLLDRD